VKALIAGQRADWIVRLDELHLLTPMRIVLIVVGAFVATLIVKLLIGRLVRRVVGLSPLSGGERTTPRGRSLSGALRSAVLVAIWVIAAIAIISELGVNVGGVVLTATVVGGALAFGAQTLVRDLIAGVFVLAEDQYGVGDIIDVGPLVGGSTPVTGTVERISLRATRLRDAEGRVWHVPNGAIVRVANLSLRSVAVLELHVNRSTSVEHLKSVALGLGVELQSHPEAGPLCGGEPEYDGVIDMQDDRLVGRIRVQTLPGRHDEVRRVWRELSIAAYQDGRLHLPPLTTDIHHISTD
jgi:moderate conductance mechanosensitive channel